MQEVRRFESGRLHQFFPGLPLRQIGFVLAGFVAGEGSFVVKHPRLPPRSDGSPRLRFELTVTVASRDRPMLEGLQQFLGWGSIHDSPSRRQGWQPTSTLTVSSLRAHRAATIPFADQFLLLSAKRQQFESWRDRLLEYEATRPSQYGRGPSICKEPDCDKPVRGRGLCRSHYYRVTGY